MIISNCPPVKCSACWYGRRNFIPGLWREALVLVSSIGWLSISTRDMRTDLLHFLIWTQKRKPIRGCCGIRSRPKTWCLCDMISGEARKLCFLFFFLLPFQSQCMIALSIRMLKKVGSHSSSAVKRIFNKLTSL